MLAASPARPDRGRPLDAGTAGRMGAALGHSFADVRIHDDPSAGEEVRAQSAIATTVGTDIAFAPGAYQPGTAHGDALLAHELAHVQQQRGASNSNVAPASGDSRALEDDADRATVGALAQMHGLGEPGAARGATRSAPRTIQRCGGAPSWAPAMPPGSATPTASAPADMMAPAQVDAMLSASATVGPYVRPKMNPTGACAGSPKAVTGHVQYHEPTQFADAQINYLSRVRHPQHSGACGRNYTETEARGNRQLHGFADDDMLHVNSAIASSATPLHEGLHFFQTGSIYDEYGQGGMEGMTEFFTRRLLTEALPALLPGRLGHYDAEHDSVDKMVRTTGTGPVCEAYFNGDFGALRRAVDAGNPGRYAQWCGFMKQVPPDTLSADALF